MLREWPFVLVWMLSAIEKEDAVWLVELRAIAKVERKIVRRRLLFVLDRIIVRCIPITFGKNELKLNLNRRSLKSCFLTEIKRWIQIFSYLNNSNESYASTCVDVECC